MALHAPGNNTHCPGNHERVPSTSLHHSTPSRIREPSTSKSPSASSWGHCGGDPVVLAGVPKPKRSLREGFPATRELPPVLPQSLKNRRGQTWPKMGANKRNNQLSVGFGWRGGGRMVRRTSLGVDRGGSGVGAAIRVAPRNNALFWHAGWIFTYAVVLK